MIESSRKRSGSSLLTLASIVVVVAGLKAAAEITVPVLVSFFLTILSLPLISWLRRKGCSKALSITLTLFANLLGLSLIALIITGTVNEFTHSAPKYQASLQTLRANSIAYLDAKGIDSEVWLVDQGWRSEAVIGMISTTLVGMVSFFSNLVLILLIMAFLFFEGFGITRKLELAFGADQPLVRHFDQILSEIQHYVGIKTLVSLSTGVLAGLWVYIIGVDFAFLWGFLTFVLNYIPTLGSIFAAVPPVLLALLQLGPGAAIAVCAGYLIANVFLGVFLEPILMGRSFRLSIFVVFVSLMFWGWVWGPVGMLLSVPFTVIARILLEHSQDWRWLAILLSAEPEAMSTGKD